MNEKELIYVKTIADCKSVSKAAKKLFVAQPSLSQMLQKIEEDIGTPLFIRHHNGMELTLAGEQYYKAAKEILDIYNDFISEISYITDLQKGRLTIGTVRFMGSILMPNILPGFMKKYCNIDIYLKEELTHLLERRITDATVDFAIFHTHSKYKKDNIDYEILYKDKFVVIASKDNNIKGYSKISDDIVGSMYPKVHINSLSNEKFIVLNKGQGVRIVNDFIWEDAGYKPNIIFTSKNYSTAQELASKGVGLMIVPLQYAKAFGKDLEMDIYEIEGSNEAYWYSCIAKRPKSYTSKIASLFIQKIRDYYTEEEPI